MSLDTIESRLSSSHRTQFFAVRAEVESLVAMGHAKKDIWKLLLGDGRIQMSYSQFTRYLAPKKSNAKDSKAQPPKDSAHVQGEQSRKGPIMTFDPREEKKPNPWNVSAIGKEYLLKQVEKPS